MIGNRNIAITKRRLAYDTFTDTDATTLTSHVAEAGGTWAAIRSVGGNTTRIYSNAAEYRAASIGDLQVRAQATLATADVVVSGNLKAVATSDQVSLAARWNGTAYVANSAGSWIEGRLTAAGNISIQQFKDGVSTQLVTRATGTSVANTAQFCKLVVTGTRATFITPIGTVTATMDSTLVSNTRCGFAIAAYTTLNGNTVDNFKVEEY